MSTVIYIIDGYNLIHKHSQLAPLIDTNLEKARYGLIRFLQHHFIKKNMKIKIFFDGQPDITTHQKKFGAISIYFSKYPTEADHLICDEIRKLKDKKHTIVVSSDIKDIYNVAKAHAVRRITSDEFLYDIYSRQSRKASLKPIDDKLSASEVDDWMNYFGVDEKS
ncbi:MAG: NYN domain-containing protein [Pseudomonadota bacterium]